MGEAARRKDLVDDVRKKVGAQAADAVAELQAEHGQLLLQQKALARELEWFKNEVALAKAAPAELRRDVRSFAGALEMHAEQLENLGQRLQGCSKDLLELMDAWRVLAARVEAIDVVLDRAARPWWQRLRRVRA